MTAAAVHLRVAVDDETVRWQPSGWRCTCAEPGCAHLEQAVDLLDDELLEHLADQQRPGTPRVIR